MEALQDLMMGFPAIQMLMRGNIEFVVFGGIMREGAKILADHPNVSTEVFNRILGKYVETADIDIYINMYGKNEGVTNLLFGRELNVKLARSYIPNTKHFKCEYIEYKFDITTGEQRFEKLFTGMTATIDSLYLNFDFMLPSVESLSSLDLNIILKHFQEQSLVLQGTFNRTSAWWLFLRLVRHFKAGFGVTGLLMQPVLEEILQDRINREYEFVDVSNFSFIHAFLRQYGVGRMSYQAVSDLRTIYEVHRRSDDFLKLLNQVRPFVMLMRLV